MEGTEPTDQGAGFGDVQCSNCNAGLAHDQRYCLECGARRWPLRGWIAERIAAIHEKGRPPLPFTTVTETAVTATSRLTLLGVTMPEPRLVAVIVMGVLSFGVVVGSIASPTIADLATAPIIIVERAIGGTAGSSTNSGSGDSSAGGGGGGTRTITITSPLPTPTPAGVVAATPATTPASSSSVTPASGSPGLPPIKHEFLIVLTQHGFNQTFSPVSSDTYLSKTLTKQGKLIENYYAVAASPLANEIALISGEGPTQQTAANCPVFAPIMPAKKGPKGQVLGGGCVYPSSTETIAGQLTAKKQTWKAYVEGMGKATDGKELTCRHPQLGGADSNQTPGPKDPYLTWRNPFVYFGSLSPHRQCSRSDVGLDHLAQDLKTPATAPTLAYIVPSACDDGSEQPCALGAPAGLTAADRFLKSVIPQIEQSAAYKDHGLIAITFDQAPQTGAYADASACCNPPTYPNLRPQTGTTASTSATRVVTTTTSSGLLGVLPGSTTTTTSTPTTASPTTAPPTTGTTTTTTDTTTTTPTITAPGTGGQTTSTGGGGKVGLLLISAYVKPGTLDVIDYFNHYSLLASMEKLFGLGRLGYANDIQLPIIDPSVFDGPG